MSPRSAATQFDAGPRFEVQRLLGEGGMGVVYEAFDRERQEAVALKKLGRNDPEWLARFKREFRAIHELSHPNLVALHELFDNATDPFFTMELIRGVDFVEYVRGAPAHLASPPCDEQRLRAALAELTAALAALHAAGKIHCDIKPSNIMVTASGRVVLLDFGLISDAHQGFAVSDRRGAGSAHYMAPEQAVDAALSPAADWYSVGVLLFESLTGALPHTGRTRYEVMLRKQQHDAPPPRQLQPAVPADLDALCIDLMQRAPGDRPAADEIFERIGAGGGHPRRDSFAPGNVSVLPRRPFVGRSDELAELRAAYDRASTSPLIYLVEGGSGVGKSELVERFVEQLRDDEPDAVILSGRCYEREVVSFKAFDGIADALARYLAQLPPVQVAELMPLRAALVGRLFPVLKRVEAIALAPDVRDLPEPNGQRRRMFAALRELFIRLAARHRLVWYIDDLHWSDADSFVLMQELLAHEHALPVLVVATLRPIDDSARVVLLDKLQEIAPVVRRRLAELSPGDARELVRLLLPAGDPTAVETTAREAGGHPLFLHELARHVASSGETGAAGVAGASLEQMLAVRIARLDPRARRLLETLSVFGGPLTQEAAAIAAELVPAEQTDAARDLRVAKLARTNGVRASDEIVVYHDRVREHVNAGLDDDGLRHVHTRLAMALEQTGAAERAPRALVRHARAAGRHGLAATYAHAAAQHAVASLAFDQAAEFFKIAIELGDPDEPTLRSLRIELATALVNAGRGAEGADALIAAAENADPITRMECRLRAAEQLLSSGHLDRGLAVVGDLLAEMGTRLPRTPRGALVHLLASRARLRLRGLRWKERHERAISDADLTRLDVFKAVGVGLNMVDTIRGADFQARHLLLALDLGEPARICRALAHEACYLSTQGARGRRRARHLIAECEHIRDRVGTPYLEGWVFTANALVAYMGGEFVSARTLFAKAEAIFHEQTVGKTWELNTVRLFQLFTLRHLGEIGELRRLSNTYMRDARRRSDLLTETSMRRVRNIAWLAEGRAEAAIMDLERTAWTPPGGAYHLQHYYELESRIELALFEGRAAPALAQHAAEFDRLSGSLLVRIQIVRAISTWLRGRLAVAAAAEGADRATNLATARRCARAISDEDAAYGRVWALLLEAAVAAQEGDVSSSIAALAESADLARSLGMADCEASAVFRRGQLLGGEPGAALQRDAETSMRQRGVTAPDARAQIIAPGFAAAGTGPAR